MVTEQVVLKDIPPRKIAYLKCKGSWRQLPAMITKLNELITKKGLEPKGPVSGIYYNTPQEVDYQSLSGEIYYPIGFDIAELEESTGFGIRELAGARVATIVHKGTYRSAGSSYALIEEWLHNEGLKVCGPAEEIYLSDITDSQKEQEIEIRLPVFVR